MIDAGKAYNAANKQFVNGIRELAQQSTKDEVIEVNKNIILLHLICTKCFEVFFCFFSSLCCDSPPVISSKTLKTLHLSKINITDGVKALLTSWESPDVKKPLALCLITLNGLHSASMVIFIQVWKLRASRTSHCPLGLAEVRCFVLFSLINFACRGKHFLSAFVYFVHRLSL